jgi:hypothetical protein
VSEHLDENSLEDSLDAEVHESSGDTEEVDALVVLDDLQIIEPVRPVLPVRPAATGQLALTAAVAATGFAAGAALVGLAHRRQHTPSRARSKRVRRQGDSSGVREIAQIVGSRSFLVDVHLLSGSGRDR